MLNLRRENIKIFPLKCQLEDDKLCDNCCDCFVCDLDPSKICDNCAKCLNLSDYNSVVIDEIMTLEEVQGRKKKKVKQN